MLRRCALSAILGVLAYACGGPTPDGSAAFGPLAMTSEPADFAAAASGGEGVLQVGKACVTLSDDRIDREVTLVWRRDQTSWDGSARQILFDDPILGEIRLSDGDRIGIGGAGIVESNSEEPVASVPWLVSPDASCPENAFAVHSVIRLDE